MTIKHAVCYKLPGRLTTPIRSATTCQTVGTPEFQEERLAKLMSGKRPRVLTKDDPLLPRLDPSRHSRLPDHYFTVQHLPGVLARFFSLELMDDGALTTLRAELPVGSRPKTAILHATKEVEIYDVFFRHLIPVQYWLETTRKRNSSSSKLKTLSIVPGIPGTLTLNPSHVFFRL